MRAPKVCPHCPNLQPCPVHTRKPWQGSRRRELTDSRYRGAKGVRRAERVLRRYDRVCHVCGDPMADEVDHVVPLAEGGPDDESNLRPIHSVPCHRDKTAEEARRARNR